MSPCRSSRLGNRPPGRPREVRPTRRRNEIRTVMAKPPPRRPILLGAAQIQAGAPRRVVHHQLIDEPADARIGTRVGNYQVDSLLGVGGMGKVYAATAGDGTRVALKIVKDDYARDETFMARFSLEARIARDIRNPHVVRVLESGE